MKVLDKQLWHFTALMALLVLVYRITETDRAILAGSFLDLSTRFWLGLTLVVPVVHQMYVLICWRSELYRRSMTKSFGSKAFSIYKTGFAVLFALRPVSLICLGISNANSLEIDPYLSYTLAILLLLPSLYLFYSVRKYFGINRAFGIDHFDPERFRDESLVKRGIFRYTANGMYVFGFLLLWSLAFFFSSKAALVGALFNHAYIWVHYFFTERPDMRKIYGTSSKVR